MSDNREDLPGYRELYLDYDHAPIEEKLKFWRQTGNRGDYALKLGMLTRPDAKIDLKELEKAPLFEIDPSFPTEPPVEFQKGEEPALAPMTQEQLRLLLMRFLPDEIKPFIEDNFVFKYDAKPLNHTHTGPTLETQGDKVFVTLYRDDFLTKGKPPIVEGQKTRSKYIWSYVDPAKVAFLFGKIIGIMTLPDQDAWDKIDISREFGASSRRLKKSQRNHPNNLTEASSKPWQDFVGLCVTLPEEAKRKFPLAYEYYQERLKYFADPMNDQIFRDMLDGKKLNDFTIRYDIRTDEEKAAANPLSPQRNFYDNVFRSANYFLNELGLRIRYTMPEDEERAMALADDDKEVARLIENYDEEARDKQFGQLLATSQSWDKKARNEARRYLIAASREGEFDDWRIYAWLYKFSDRFRNPRPGLPVGSEISEDDYLDLKIIYKISEKEGGRIGTGVVPYDPIVSEKDPFAARDQFVYVRKANYLDAVRRKIDMKSARGVYDVNPKVFDEFFDNKKYIEDLDANYTAAHLLPYLRDAKFTEELIATLDKLNTKRISPDARAVAEAYWHHYLANDRTIDAHMSEKAIRLIQHYEGRLDRPTTNRVREFLDEIKGIDLATLDPKKRSEYLQASDAHRKTTENSILSQAESIGILEDVQGELEKQLHNNVVDIKSLRLVIHNFIDTNHPLDKANTQKRVFDMFMYKNGVADNLEILRELVEFQETAEPLYQMDVAKLVNDAKATNEVANIIIPDHLDDATYQANFAGQDFSLTPKQEAELARLNTAYASFMTDSTQKTIDKTRSDMLRGNILTAKPEIRLKMIGKLLEKGIIELQNKCNQAAQTGNGYGNIAEVWKRDNAIFSTPPLKNFTNEVEQVLIALDQARPDTSTRIRLQRRLTKAVEQLAIAAVSMQP